MIHLTSNNVHKNNSQVVNITVNSRYCSFDVHGIYETLCFVLFFAVVILVTVVESVAVCAAMYLCSSAIILFIQDSTFIINSVYLYVHRVFLSLQKERWGKGYSQRGGCNNFLWILLHSEESQAPNSHKYQGQTVFSIKNATAILWQLKYLLNFKISIMWGIIPFLSITNGSKT